jgi:hypothetical protein
MTILDLKALKDYIKNNSNSNSKLSAKNISPKLIKKFFDRYDFEYLGSSFLKRSHSQSPLKL